MATKANRKSRKRRAAGSTGGTAPQAKKQAKRLEERAAREQVHRKENPAPHPLDVRYGVLRPKPIWSPFPLTEIASVIGIAMAVIGFVVGTDSGASLIGAGVLIVTVTIGEMCLREHLAGFKSHTLLLAGLPVVALHSLIYFVITKSWSGPAAIFVDLTVAGMLGLLLHGKWRTAHASAREAAGTTR